ncbi:hypothetical protein IF803_40020 [Bradyrhizobium sp. UFLA06-06]
MPKLQAMPLRLRVAVDEDKTRILPAGLRRQFLSVRFRKDQTPAAGNSAMAGDRAGRCIASGDTSEPRIERETGVPLGDTITRFNSVLRSWGGYFLWLNAAQHSRQIGNMMASDKHQRRRLALANPVPSGKRRPFTGSSKRIEQQFDDDACRGFDHAIRLLPPIGFGNGQAS